MSLKDRLAADYKAAIKNKNIAQKNAVQMVRAEILQLEKDSKAQISEDDILAIIAKEIKRRRDVLPDYQKNGRREQVDKINLEISHLLQYLPPQLSVNELEKMVEEAIAETGAESVRDMGKVMGAVLPRVKGRADGKTINEIVRKKLS